MVGATQGPYAASERRILLVWMRVWDLPTRLFHWALVTCIISACISARTLDEQALRLHFFSGYAVLTLVGFRVLWGFAGSQYPRFRQFIRGPLATARYALLLLRGRLDASASQVGHNPLGAASVLALLAVSAALAISGLFAKDYVASEGPLARLVSEKMVDRSSTLHAWGEPLLYTLVALHVSAIAYYRLAHGQNLLGPMLTGNKLLRAKGACEQAGRPLLAKQKVDADELAPDAAGGNARALVLLGFSAALVAYLMRL